MVYMAHDRDDRRTGHEIIGVILILSDDRLIVQGYQMHLASIF